MIIDRKIRIGRSMKNDVKRFRINIPADYSNQPKLPTKKMRQILPILFKLQDIENFHPERVLEIIALVAENNTVRFISPTEKDRLKNYLYKWGYDNSWVE